MLKRSRLGIIFMAGAIAMVGVGCKKKPGPTAPVAATPPPPPPAPEPTNTKTTILEFSVEPTTVERGQSAVLKWSVSNANAISIDNGIGQVQSNGTRRVIPSDSTTYTLTAAGASGTVTASTTVNVTSAPAPSGNVTPKTGPTDFVTAVNTLLNDAYFDYDSNNIRGDARDTLSQGCRCVEENLCRFSKCQRHY